MFMFRSETIYRPPIVNGEGDTVTADPCLLSSGGHLLFSDVPNTMCLWGHHAGSDEGIAYLKVFLSSQYTDFSLVERKSPFDLQYFATTTWGQEWSLESLGDLYDPFVEDGTTSSTLRLRGGAMRPYKARARAFWESLTIPIHRTRKTVVESSSSVVGYR